MRFNKKASLEISIQAIVIVVLAMTLLGLGLGFIRGMFRSIGDTTTDVTEQVRQRVLDDLISGDKKVSFPKTEIFIDRGGSQVLTVGIKNKKDTDLYYKMKFTLISGPPEASESEKAEFVTYFQFAEKQEYSLKAAEADVRNIRLSLPTTVKTGSYQLTFDVLEQPTNVYAQKDFFVVVRG